MTTYADKFIPKTLTTEYSSQAERVLRELKKAEIKQLRKENPFRNERNAKIKELFKRGVKIVVIAEISGLSETSLSYIIKKTS